MKNILAPKKRWQSLAIPTNLFLALDELSLETGYQLEGRRWSRQRIAAALIKFSLARKIEFLRSVQQENNFQMEGFQ